MYSMAEQWFMEKNLNISMTQINACVHWKFCLTERDSDRVRSRGMCWMEHTGKDWGGRDMMAPQKCPLGCS